MVLLQNTKPKITRPKIFKIKKNWPKFEFLWRAKFKILDGLEHKIMKIDSLSFCETKFFVTLWKRYQKTKNFKKTTFLFFAAYYFLIFLDTQMHEPKISEKTISD